MNAQYYCGKDRMFDEAIRNLWFLRTFAAEDYERLWKEITGTMIYTIGKNIPDEFAGKLDWGGCWRLRDDRPYLK
jgi:hypothetical protein